MISILHQTSNTEAIIVQIARDIFDSYETACELVLKITFALERFHDYAEIFQGRTTNLLERRLVQYVNFDPNCSRQPMRPGQ